MVFTTRNKKDSRLSSFWLQKVSSPQLLTILNSCLSPAAAGAAPLPGRALPVTLRTLGVWLSLRPQASEGEPKGPPSGKEGKQTWEADESQEHPSLRGSARVAGARPSSVRFKGQQGQLASRALSAWLGSGRPQKKLLSSLRRDGI